MLSTSEIKIMPKNKEINPDRLLILYLILGLFLVRAVDIPEIIKAFYAATVFFILPEQFGKSVYILVEKITKKDFLAEFDFITNYILYWCSGVILLMVIAFGLSILDLFSMINMIIIVSFLLIFNFLSSKETLVAETTDFLKEHRYFLVICLIIGFMVSAFLHSKSPFPYYPQYDPFQDMFVAKRMIYLNEFHLFTHEYSDLIFLQRYDIRAFQLLIALSGVWGNVELLHIFWAAPFVYLPLFSVGIYLFSYKVYSKKAFGLFSAFIGGWVMESRAVSGMYVFRSTVILWLFFPYILFSFHESANKRKLFRLFLVLFTFSLVYHKFDGLVMVGLLFSYAFMQRVLEKEYVPTIARLAIIAILGLLVLHRSFGILPLDSFQIDPFKTVFSSRPVNFDFYMKLNYIKEFYTNIVLYFIIMGILLSSIINGSKELIAVTFLGTSILALYFLPIAYSSRFILYDHLFLTIISVYSISIFLKLLSKISIIDKSLNRTLNLILTVSILIVLSSELITPTQKIIERASSEDNIATSFTEYELNMGRWLLKNVEPDAVIIGEAMTQQIMSGLTYRHNIGGYYMGKEKIEIVKKILSTTDAEVAANLSKNLVKEKNPIIIVISGRASNWVRYRNNYNPVWNPEKFEYFQGFDKFYNTTYFEPLYQIDGQIYALKVRRE